MATQGQRQLVQRKGKDLIRLAPQKNPAPATAAGFFLVEKPVDSFGTSVGLSTGPAGAADLLSATLSLQGLRPTDLDNEQTLVGTAKMVLVHRRVRALLRLPIL